MTATTFDRPPWPASCLMPEEQVGPRLDRIHHLVDDLEREIRALADASWGPDGFATIRALPETDVKQLAARIAQFHSRLGEVATTAHTDPPQPLR